MKNLIVFVIGLSLSFGSFAQTTLAFKPQGGIFVGVGEEQLFVGFLGPKISVQMETKKLQLELGVLGSPGLFMRPEPRLGLIAGPFISVARVGKKGKLVFAVPLTFVNKKGKALPGIGLIF